MIGRFEINFSVNFNASVRDKSKVGFAQIAFSPTLFNILALNFQDMRKSAFCA